MGPLMWFSKDVFLHMHWVSNFTELERQRRKRFLFRLCQKFPAPRCTFENILSCFATAFKKNSFYYIYTFFLVQTTNNFHTGSVYENRYEMSGAFFSSSFSNCSDPDNDRRQKRRRQEKRADAATYWPFEPMNSLNGRSV